MTTLDEAYERLHATGPEWGGNLSNHGPMAAEVLARRGHGDDVPAWVDAYLKRLDELPRPSEPVPHLADQSGPIAGRLARLGDLDGWPGLGDGAALPARSRNRRRLETASGCAIGRFGSAGLDQRSCCLASCWAAYRVTMMSTVRGFGPVAEPA